MGGEWRHERFQQMATLVRNAVLPAEASGLPYIGLEHIGEGTLQLIDTGVAENVTSTKTRFRAGDILFGKLRPYFRKVVRPRFDGICSTDIWVVRPPNGVDSLFLFYLMASDLFVEPVVRASEGTKMPRGKWEYASSLELPLPPLAEQRAIAHILGTLDDKIELNRRMSQTLEAMARALFKSWFVDFEPVRAKMAGRLPASAGQAGWQRGQSLPGLPAHLYDLFPDLLVDSELGEIPEGWEVGRVADIGKIICGKTPSTRNRENYGSDIPFITIPDMHGKIFVVVTQKRLSHAGAASQLNKMLPPGAICVSCIATPGLVVITSETAQTNQQINTVIPSNKDHTFYWYWILRELGSEIRTGGSGGSVLSNLSTKRFAGLRIVAATHEIRSAYGLRVAPLFSRILATEREIITLAALRDALLPKLISGEIRVKDAERFLEERGL